MVYAVAIPLALVLGYALSTGLGSNEDTRNLMIVGVAIFLLALPIVFQWHHILLIFAWNAIVNVPFLPGQPRFWLLLAVLSFVTSWLNGLLGRSKFLRVPELTRPLLFLGAVVMATGMARGGIGLNALGSSFYGGRHYIYLLGAIIGYFALTAVRIPLAKARRVAGLSLSFWNDLHLGKHRIPAGAGVCLVVHRVPQRIRHRGGRRHLDNARH